MNETTKKVEGTETETEKVFDLVEETEMEPEKPYTFRTLNATDVFLMSTIVSKIGINEFTACFEKDSIKDAIKSFTGEKDEAASIVGISVGLEIANVIMGNLQFCEKEIFQMLAKTSNLSEKQIKDMDMVTFFEMVIDFIKKDEFKDFMKVVSKLFK